MVNNDKAQKQFGEKLKNIREKAGLTQADIAMKAGINVSYYARIERGEINPSLAKIQSIMKALHIKSLDIL
jgi:transcriptional regulator with XRE-family HTH domain